MAYLRWLMREDVHGSIMLSASFLVVGAHSKCTCTSSWVNSGVKSCDVELLPTSVSNMKVHLSLLDERILWLFAGKVRRLSRFHGNNEHTTRQLAWHLETFWGSLEPQS
ncbi:uncharacterized protein [Diadema setosum]|uniref:uncharacterized protein n=1 Tax=Diadema setosum TaxID=31175 RepID=UPI003B3B85FF